MDAERATAAPVEKIIFKSVAAKPRRALRGSWQDLPLYRIDAEGQAHEVSQLQLQLLYLAACALDGVEQLGWPMRIRAWR